MKNPVESMMNELWQRMVEMLRTDAINVTIWEIAN